MNPREFRLPGYMIRFDPVLGNPLIRKDLVKALTGLSGKFEITETTTNFFALIVKNRRFKIIHAIFQEYNNLLDNHMSVVRVQVITAMPLTPEQDTLLRESLEDALNQGVVLEPSVDEKLLGGIKIQIGSKQIDTSIQGKIRRIQDAMLEKA